MLIEYWRECKIEQPLWKTVWQFLQKLNIYPPRDPTILSLDIYPSEIKVYVYTKTWKKKKIFIAFWKCQWTFDVCFLDTEDAASHMKVTSAGRVVITVSTAVSL